MLYEAVFAYANGVGTASVIVKYGANTYIFAS